jgi:hypothetical protein
LDSEGGTSHTKLLQTYIRNFQPNLTSFKFRWNGERGAIPLCEPPKATPTQDVQEGASGTSQQTRRRGTPPLRFPKLKSVDFGNVKASADDISSFARAHKRTVEVLNFEDVELEQGTWDDALAPLTKLGRPRASEDMANIPIMLSPTSFPAPMERIEVAHRENNGRKSLRMSRWLSTKHKTRTPHRTPSAASRKVREGLLGCEESLKKVFRGSAFPWR